MPPRSNDTVGDWSQFPDNIDHPTRHPSPPRRRRGRVDSREISGLGAIFDHIRDPYPPQLNFSEEDLYVAEPSDTHQATSSSTPPPARGAERGYWTNQDETPNPPISPMAAYLTANAFLNESDLEQFRRQQGARRSRSQGTGSSGQSRRSSEYQSARSGPATSVTDASRSDVRGESRHSETGSSQYFTPSNHTPSHYSTGTIEEQETGSDDRSAHGPSPDLNHNRSVRNGTSGVGNYTNRFHV